MKNMLCNYFSITAMKKKRWFLSSNLFFFSRNAAPIGSHGKDPPRAQRVMGICVERLSISSDIGERLFPGLSPWYERPGSTTDPGDKLKRNSMGRWNIRKIATYCSPNLKSCIRCERYFFYKSETRAFSVLACTCTSPSGKNPRKRTEC